MQANAQAIVLLCSQMCKDETVRPFEPAEWSALAALMLERGCSPEEFLRFTENDVADRLGLDEQTRARCLRLLDRAGSMEFELAKYENMGIRVLTRADAQYPIALKQKLKNSCPPLFYYAGELSILNAPLAGYVGARTVTEQDEAFTRIAVEKTVKSGYGVVTGGAKGVDAVAARTALAHGAPTVEFPADSMLRKLRQTEEVRAIQDGKLLLLSVVRPDAGFSVGVAMMRNRYIYAQSQGTVVIRSDLNKGGTWAGAVENLRHNWCPTFCRDCAYPGNRELIRQGAIPVDEAWSGDLTDVPKVLAGEQLSFF